MSLYVIGDLHLSFSVDKPMNIFGKNWENHEEKIKESWMENISENDTVILTGDTSWGINREEAEIDLEWISNLPGKKILVKGNHDYWWESLSKMNKIYTDFSFIYNNYHVYEDYAICGSRGWLCPNQVMFTDSDLKIYKREAMRVENSIKKAIMDGYNKIIIATHYPPTNEKFEDSLFTEIYEKYNVEKVVYGHLHTEDSFKCGLNGTKNNIEYRLTSCDYLKFKVLKLI